MRPDRIDNSVIGPSFTDFASFDDDLLLFGSCSPGVGYEDTQTICPSELAGFTTVNFGPYIEPTLSLDVPDFSGSSSSSFSKGSPRTEPALTPLSMSADGAAPSSVVSRQSRYVITGYVRNSVTNGIQTV